MCKLPTQTAASLDTCSNKKRVSTRKLISNILKNPCILQRMLTRLELKLINICYSILKKLQIRHAFLASSIEIDISQTIYSLIISSKILKPPSTQITKIAQI